MSRRRDPWDPAIAELADEDMRVREVPCPECGVGIDELCICAATGKPYRHTISHLARRRKAIAHGALLR